MTNKIHYAVNNIIGDYMTENNLYGKYEKLWVNLILFLFGAYSYGLIEIFWRGYTHISMCIAGGICFLIFGIIWESLKNLPKIYIPIIGSVIITAIELIFGLIFNIILKKQIWNYSNLKFNFLGQISILFSTLWGLLSIAAMPLAGKIKQMLYSNIEY